MESDNTTMLDEGRNRGGCYMSYVLQRENGQMPVPQLVDEQGMFLDTFDAPLGPGWRFSSNATIAGGLAKIGNNPTGAMQTFGHASFGLLDLSLQWGTTPQAGTDEGVGWPIFPDWFDGVTLRLTGGNLV